MRRDVLLLSVAAFTSSASLRATDPLLPLIAEDYGVTTGAAAAAVTAFALAYGLLQVVCGPLGDRYGRYRTIAAAAFVSAFGSAACAAAPDMPTLIAARFVAGATIGAFIPLSLAWIGDSFPYEQRQPVLARFLIGQMVGIGFGAAAAGWLAERFGWRAIFVLLAAVLLLIALLIALEARRQPRPVARGGIAQSFARMPRLLAERSVRGLLAIGFSEGLLIFGALAFVALHFQRRFGVGPGAAGAAPLRRDRPRHARRRRARGRLCAARKQPVACARGLGPRGNRRRLLYVPHDAADEAHPGGACIARLGRGAIRHVSLHGAGERRVARLESR